MNKTFWMMLAAAAVCSSACADQPAAGSAAAAPTAVNQRPAGRAAAELVTVPLVPGPAVVAANRVNVRGQAKLNSEVITRMTNGEPVTVIEEVHLNRSGPDEPSAWAKIVLPAKARAWVHTSFLDSNTKTVTATRLNLRGGPGENYSILGRLEKGDVVKEIETRGNWMAIEPPPGAYAFMAAQYLRQDIPVVAEAAPAVSEPAPVANTNEVPLEAATVQETPSVAIAAAEPPPAMADSTTPPPAVPAVGADDSPAQAVEPTIIEDAPAPPRVVQREGFVRSTFSIQAPTEYQLISPENQRPINYLFTTSTNLDLSRYKGLHIIVTGEEGLDVRWKNTPVLTIQRIQVLD